MSRLGKILIVVAACVIIAILISVIHHYQLRAAVNDYIAQLKAHGEPVELAQVIPPPVPSQTNGAAFITNSLARIDLDCNITNWAVLYNAPDAMNITIPGKEMVGWHQPVIHSPRSWPRDLTNTWDELDAQLVERQNDICNFRRLIENPVIDFAHDYSSLNVYNPVLDVRLEQIREVPPWLLESEVYELHRGKTGDACMDVRAMLALVKAETNDRYEISQLVRFGITRVSADATWNILQATNVSDTDLEHLQHDWQSLEFTHPLRNAFLFERVNTLRWLDRLRQSPTNFRQWFGSVYLAHGYKIQKTGNANWPGWTLVNTSSLPMSVINKIPITWDKNLWRWFRSYTDELRALQMWQLVINGTRLIGTHCSYPAVQSFVKSNHAWHDSESLRNDPYAVFSLNASQLSVIGKLAGVETIRNIVVTAIALKRYVIRNHRLPSTLNELTRSLLESVPVDWMDGRPLRYRRNADGTFLLYSVGENGKDDDGNPAQPSNHNDVPDYDWDNSAALDWVWPQPATAQEIQRFYDRLSKNAAN